MRNLTEKEMINKTKTVENVLAYNGCVHDSFEHIVIVSSALCQKSSSAIGQVSS